MRKLTLLLCSLAIFTLMAAAQGLSDPALQAAISAVDEVVPNLGRPVRWEFEILLPTNDSALSCPLVPGVQLADQKRPYVVDFFYANGSEYTVHVAEDGSRAQRCDAELPGMGMGGVGLLPPPSAPEPCRVVPSGPFANVRSAPNTDADQLGQITSERAALGRDQDWTWYLVAEGWVAGTVVSTAGDCLSNNLSIRSELIALGLAPLDATTDDAQPTPIPFATAASQPTALPPSDTTCPPDFVGYLPPRIQSGEATAQVEPGGLPNTLRAAPMTSAERVGAVQPGRRLDFVLNGPQCSDGYVWWEVEVDGVRGWTAESSAADNAYFLAPTAGNVVSAAPTAIITTAAAGVITLEDGQQLVERSAGAPADANAIAPFSGNAYAWVRGQDVYTTPLTASNPVPTLPLPERAGLTTISHAPSGLLFIGASDGTLLGYDPDVRLLPVDFAAHASPVNAIAFSPSVAMIATGSGGTETDPATWTLRLWDEQALVAGNTSGARLRSIRFPYPVSHIAFSPDGAHMAVVAQQAGPEPAAALWVYADGGRGDNILTVALPDPGQAFVSAAPTGFGDFIYGQGSTLVSLVAATGEERVRYSDVDGDIVQAASVNPAERSVYAVGSTNGVIVARAGSGDMQVLPTVNAGAVAFSADGTILAVRRADGTWTLFTLP